MKGKQQWTGRLAAVLLILLAGIQADENPPPFRSGDIIFQTTASDFSRAIGLATKSIYTHMGLIVEQEGDYWVFEAVQPVRFTPLAVWIDRGVGDHYAVKRLRDADKVLTEAALGRLFAVGQQFLGKDYDPLFGWSDDRLYCSELVWKVYQEALGIELGRLAPLDSYDLDHALVQQQLRQHHGDHIPYDELMIAPQTIFDAVQLEQIWQE